MLLLRLRTHIKPVDLLVVAKDYCLNVYVIILVDALSFNVYPVGFRI
jgi:hypothetical protein